MAVQCCLCCIPSPTLHPLVFCLQVEGNCFINASSVAAGDAEGEPGTITFAPVKIGRDCTLGSQTSVGPGTDLPDGGVVKVSKVVVARWLVLME